MGNAIHLKSGFVTSFLRSRNGWWHSLWNEYAMASYEIRYKIIQTRKSFGAIQAYSDPAMMAEQNLKTMLLSYMKKYENVSRRRLVFFLFVLRYLLHTWWINFLFFTLESSLTGCKNYSIFQFSHFLFFLQCRSENLAYFHLLGTAAVSECVSQRAGRWSWSGRHEMYAMRAYRKLRLRSAPNKISIPALWTLMNRQGIYLAAGMWGAPDFVLLLIALQSELDGFPGKVLFGVSSSDFL